MTAPPIQQGQGAPPDMAGVFGGGGAPPIPQQGAMPPPSSMEAPRSMAQNRQAFLQMLAQKYPHPAIRRLVDMAKPPMRTAEPTHVRTPNQSRMDSPSSLNWEVDPNWKPGSNQEPTPRPWPTQAEAHNNQFRPNNNPRPPQYDPLADVPSSGGYVDEWGPDNSGVP